MEFLVIILLIILIILTSQTRSKVGVVERRLIDLTKYLKEKKLEQSKHADLAAPIHEKIQEEVKPESLPIAEEGSVVSVPGIKPIAEEDTKPAETEAISDKQKEDAEKERPEPVYAHSIADIVAKHQKAEQAIPIKSEKEVSKIKRLSFLEKNPDIEKFIGENLLSKIGIVIFVIGMGFLVKLGIDNNVITEPMRVAIGVLIGGAMIGLAHKLRASFANFSSVLIGGALAVLYFTIALAFHEYHLIPQVAAFLIMVFITAFGVLLSILYDRKTLAILAIIGGFGTPIFVNTGSGDLGILITYIIILDLGMLVLAYFKKWNSITYIAYGFTYLLFIGAYSTKFLGNEDVARLPMFVFLTTTYIIFFLMTIVYNVRFKRVFKYPEIMMLLSNSALYFGFGLAIVQGYNEGQLSGLFTSLIALFNFLFAFVLYKRKDIDTNLLYLLIGLVLTFVSLIAPIQLQGNYITMFWALESVLLLWLAQKSGIQLMKLVAVIVSGLVIVSLLMDWQQYNTMDDYSNALNIFVNKIFITSFISILSMVANIRLLREDEEVEFRTIKFIWRSAYVKVALAVITYLAILLELNYQFSVAGLNFAHKSILLGVYNFIFITVLIIGAKYASGRIVQITTFILSAIAVFSYMFYYVPLTIIARSFSQLSLEESTGYYWHYILLILLIYIVIEGYKYIHKNYSFNSREGALSLYFLSFLVVFVSTTEIGHISMILQYGSGIEQHIASSTTIRSVYPAVWTITALGLMIVGMKVRLKALRIASLALFTVTIAKLFLFDLAGNTTGRIISFILLGLILLVISFLYQKLKFIIQDDEKS